MAPRARAGPLPLASLLLVLPLLPAFTTGWGAPASSHAAANTWHTHAPHPGTQDRPRLNRPRLNKPQDNKPQQKTAPFPRHGRFTGKATCLDCHQVQGDAIQAGHHAAVLKDHSLQGCESCHGPGHAHAFHEDNDTGLITLPPALHRQDQVQLCSRCHAGQIRDHGGDMAGFFAAGKVCTSCHKVHEQVPAAAHPGLAFRTRADADKHAREVGSGKCIDCHPLRDSLLQQSYHRSLASTSKPDGCETCHGNGSLHVETGGLGRLITRPDRAADGKATCRSCHPQVDAEEFHWKGRHKPLLSQGLTCTSCHQVHRPVLQKLGGEPERLAGTAAGPQRRGPSAPRKTTSNRVCMKCHEPAFGILVGTIHESIGKPDQPLDKGCGACHDGAEVHARNAGRKHLIDSLHGTDARHQGRVCMKCHAEDAAMRSHRVGSHFRKGVGCLQCHSPAAARDRVRADAEANCSSCHQDIAAEFRLPNRHPVDVSRKDRNRPTLGRMACTSCHDAHAARPKIRNRTLRFETCVNCHKEYRGPYVYEHQASRTEYCVACHTPHGSPNKRLLKQVNSQQNCLQCHGDFPSFHDQTQGAVFTDCLRCHTQVHGSNINRYLIR